VGCRSQAIWSLRHASIVAPGCARERITLTRRAAICSPVSVSLTPAREVRGTLTLKLGASAVRLILHTRKSLSHSFAKSVSNTNERISSCDGPLHWAGAVGSGRALAVAAESGERAAEAYVRVGAAGGKCARYSGRSGSGGGEGGQGAAGAASVDTASWQLRLIVVDDATQLRLDAGLLAPLAGARHVLLALGLLMPCSRDGWRTGSRQRQLGQEDWTNARLDSGPRARRG